MFYFKIDLLETIKGSGAAPFVVMAYVNRLPDDGKFAASLIGDDTWFGWGQDRALHADIYDALARLTEVQISKGTGKKPPKLERWPRPERPKKAEQKKSRLLELHAMFMGGSGVQR